jgi:hypothetical protein
MQIMSEQRPCSNQRHIRLHTQTRKVGSPSKTGSRIGLEQNFYRPPQTTRFKDGPNSTGVMMHASTGSGMDSTGVNDGSKSSTLVNYLSDAWNWGAEMYVLLPFLRLTFDAQRLLVAFVNAKFGSSKRLRREMAISFSLPGMDRKGEIFGEIFEQDLMWVHAKHCVFLAAGTLGNHRNSLAKQAAWSTNVPRRRYKDER